MKSRVAIIGSGPSGLMLEDTTTNILVQLGIDRRMQAEGLPRGGVNPADGERGLEIVREVSDVALPLKKPGIAAALRVFEKPIQSQLVNQERKHEISGELQ